MLYFWGALLHCLLWFFKVSFRSPTEQRRPISILNNASWGVEIQNKSLAFKNYIDQPMNQPRLSKYTNSQGRFCGADWSIPSSIVAVHGLNGDAMKTWTSGNICWLNHPDLLPKYLKRARVLTWGYNANISSLAGKSTSSDRILQHAQTLIAQLHADRDVSGSRL